MDILEKIITMIRAFEEKGYEAEIVRMNRKTYREIKKKFREVIPTFDSDLWSLLHENKPISNIELEEDLEIDKVYGRDIIVDDTFGMDIRIEAKEWNVFVPDVMKEAEIMLAEYKDKSDKDGRKNKHRLDELKC